METLNMAKEGIDYENMQGYNYHTREAAKIINSIFNHIKNSKCRRRLNATLYLGQKQRMAIRMIEGGDVMEPKGNNDFAGFNTIWVMLDSHIHLA